MHQLLRKVGQGFDWLKDFVLERNNGVYFRGRSRPSLGSAALGHPARQAKSFRRSKTKRERNELVQYPGRSELAGRFRIANHAPLGGRRARTAVRDDLRLVAVLDASRQP